MGERRKFVARLLDGEKTAGLCRKFGISRQTGSKFFRRYRDYGLDGLTDRSRRPYRQAHQLPFHVESRMVQLKQDHPSWGARCIECPTMQDGAALTPARLPQYIRCGAALSDAVAEQQTTGEERR